MFPSLHQWTLNLRDLGDLPSACSAADSLCREARTDAEAVRANQLLAELSERAGDLPSARLARERLVDLARWAVEADPTTAGRIELLSALDDLGELARRQDDHWTVLECHGNHGRMAQLRELTAANGLHPSLLTEQCYSLRRAGCAARDLGSVEEARSLFEERLTVARLVLSGSPGTPKLVALVAAALADLGTLLARLGDPRAAHLLGEELGLRNWLQSLRPDDVEARQQLARAHLAVAQTGADTEEHRAVAADLLSRMEAEGSLDITGRMLLTSLRAG